MNQALPQQSLAQIFTEARTHHGWTAEKISDQLLEELYALCKWGPTSVNSTPARFVFVKSTEGREKLLPALSGSNVAQTKAAAVTVIVAYDSKFYDHLPVLFPAFDARAGFVSNEALSAETAFRNGSLQGAYMMIAARALGLDVGPMSGFVNAKVDQAFFAGTSWKSNFLCNLGQGDPAKLYPRGPRLPFSEACKIV